MTEIDLQPTRELLARLDVEIKRLYNETHIEIARWGRQADKDWIRERWSKYNDQVAPMLRERDGVAKILTDYYARQPLPPQIIIPTPSATDRNDNT